MEMFEKKEYIYSETMGVCKVADIVKLSPNNRLSEPVWYYQLKSTFDQGKVAYIPVENHQVTLRPLMTKEEAEGILPEDLEKLDEMRRGEIRFVLEQDENRKKKRDLRR